MTTIMMAEEKDLRDQVLGRSPYQYELTSNPDQHFSLLASAVSWPTTMAEEDVYSSDLGTGEISPTEGDDFGG